MRALPLLLLLLVCAAEPALADDPAAADVTMRGRDVDRILDMALEAKTPLGKDGRALILLLDASTSLQRSDLAGELAEALERRARLLGGTRLGVATTGTDGGLLLAPTADREKTIDAVRQALSRPDPAFQNVYESVRRVLPTLRKERGEREILLLTLENGDAEDDVERTVSELARAGVRCSVVCREAFLSDAYWAENPPEGPKEVRFTGSDGPFIEIPWGWRFQWVVPNNRVLSGFAMYGLTRLAAGTGGRVFLYYPPSGAKHTCIHHAYQTCPFCAGDHEPENERYQWGRLREISPPAGPRDRVFKAALRDPFYVAVHRAWERASRAGLVYSCPSLRRYGGRVIREDYPYQGFTPLGVTVAFGSEASRARKLVRDAGEVIRELEGALSRARDQGGSERYRAIADTTLLLLQITRFNLLHYAVFCEDVGPEQVERAAGVAPPERNPFGIDPRLLGIGYRTVTLCHGVAAFRHVRLPGGEELARELQALERQWTRFSDRWRHTPFYRVPRATGLAHFYLVWRAGYTPPPGRPRQARPDEEEVVTLPPRPARPTRPGGGSSGGSAGPATGGD